MRLSKIIVLIAGIAAIACIGCSGHGNPAIPSVDEISIPMERNTEGHALWGAWNFSVDPDTLEIIIEPMRGMENHFNVTNFVLPPSCYDCITMQVLDVDMPTHTFSIKILLRNPTAITGYDIRGVVFLKGNQQLVNSDNWTDLFDIPGDLARNPFKAFATEKQNRPFIGGATEAAIYRIVLPPGNMAVSFAVDASFPTNCVEPNEMDVVKAIDFLDDTGGYNSSIEVTVQDWQSDIAAVQLDLSALGAASPVSLTFEGGVWKATVTNSYGAPAGFYTCWLQAASATGPWLFEPVIIEVKSFGADRLPEVLALMHNWTSSGDPKDPLSKSNFKYEGSDLQWIIDDMGYGSTRLPYYNSIHRAPLTTVPYCMNLLDSIDVQTENPALYNILYLGAGQLGETFTQTDYSYTPTASPIADAMETLYTAIGSNLSPSEKSAIASQTAGLPIQLQYMTAGILGSVAEGYGYRESSLGGLSTEVKDILFNNGTDWCYGTSIYIAVLEEAVDFDYANMYRAAGPVLQAIDAMRDGGLNYVPQDSSSWVWETPIGTVKIGGSADETHGSGDYLLLLDPGGNDTYQCQAGGNTSQDNGFSICVDLSGSDIYSDNGNGNYAYGAGRMGVGVLWDVNGNDQYDNFRFSQGFGHWGVGVLLDSGGNDTYNADGCSQGSGYMGIGFMIDEWGNDIYDCYQYSQGFGFVKGWGLACDIEGNDDWTANDSVVIYPGPQTADHNTSMSQGQGFGVRWDAQTVFQSGGQGILFDKSGDDDYSCGTFGQACAYWFGTGILADYEGLDTMRGIWYVQSGAAHYGTSFLINKGQDDDLYRVSHNVSMGGGHDFSNSFFLEEGGNDHYTSIAEIDPGMFPGISLGGGNDCGSGIYVDYGGDDTYDTTNGRALGHGNYLDFRNRGSWGVYIDLGGNDTYSSAKQAEGVANDATWTLGDIGAGGDFPNGIVVWQ